MARHPRCLPGVNTRQLAVSFPRPDGFSRLTIIHHSTNEKQYWRAAEVMKKLIEDFVLGLSPVAPIGVDNLTWVCSPDFCLDGYEPSTSGPSALGFVSQASSGCLR